MLRLSLLPVMFLLFTGFVQAADTDFPSGPLAVGPVVFQHAIYLVEPVKEDPKALALGILKEKYSSFKLTEEPDPKQNAIRIRVSDRIQTEYKPPDLETLRYFGKGLTKEQAEKLQAVTTAIIIDFGIPLENRTNGIILATRFMGDLSRATNGIIWDEETRQCFDLETWKAKRLDTWEDGIPDLSMHTTVHAYRDGEYIRGITLGMAKFGLPDIEVSDFPWSDSRNVGGFINLLAQLCHDIGSLDTAGKFSLNVDKIRHSRIKKELIESLHENAEKGVAIHIIEGQRDEGDPDNRIMEVVFDNFPGQNKQAKMDAMLSKLWGWKDDIDYVKHNEMILAASQRAKEKLPGIRNKILAGLAPGEYYMVKAPFKTPDDGNEWMWVEVISWKNPQEIIGLLKNQPYHIPDLKAGTQVTLNAGDIFDYIHRLPDGTSEGNETGDLIRKYSQ